MNKIFAPARALSIARKEVMHIMRDPFTLGIVFGMPLIMVIFFGFAINFDFGGIELSVFDNDLSRQSRALAEQFTASKYFSAAPGENAQDPSLDVQSEKAFLALVINRGFAKDLVSQKHAKAQILVDGTDNLKSGIVSGYISGIQKSAAEKLAGMNIVSPIEITTNFFYNPELNTQWFVVPGLIVIVTGLLSILMTALTVAREWENGSMELLLSTTVTPLEVIAGKIMPYAVIVLAEITIVCLISIIVFNMPFEGNVFVFAAACIIFVTTSLGQGLLISIVTRQQQKAMQASMLMGILPAFLLSGFIFPIASMPVFFRYFTMILPPRWFIEISRSVLLKGSGITDLVFPFCALITLNIILVAAATKKFKKDIEP